MAAQWQVFKMNLLFMKCARLMVPVTHCAVQRKRSRGTRTMTWTASPQSSPPPPQSQTEGLGYLPSPQKGYGLWTHGDTLCGTRKQMQPHSFPTLAEKMPGGASGVRLGDRSALFSWLLSCVRFLGNSMGVGAGG